jgi:membrane protease YdiL (CAAX protease family)
MYLLIFSKELREYTLLYVALFVIAEMYKTGTQAERTPFLKGLIMFSIASFVSVIFFSSVNQILQPENFTSIATVSITQWVLYFLLVAYVEEEIFRGILPKAIGNMIIPQIIYTVFHIATVSILAVNGVSIISLLIFTMLFALAMMFLTYQFKSVIPAIAVHWIYDLYKVGVLMSVFGWII